MKAFAAARSGKRDLGSSLETQTADVREPVHVSENPRLYIPEIRGLFSQEFVLIGAVRIICRRGVLPGRTKEAVETGSEPAAKALKWPFSPMFSPRSWLGKL